MRGTPTAQRLAVATELAPLIFNDTIFRFCAQLLDSPPRLPPNDRLSHQSHRTNLRNEPSDEPSNHDRQFRLCPFQTAIDLIEIANHIIITTGLILVFMMYVGDNYDGNYSKKNLRVA